MMPSTLRPSSTLAAAAFALVLGIGFALGATGCEVHHHRYHDDTIAFTVHNLHGEDVYIEGIDGWGVIEEFGVVIDGARDTFVVDDYWSGRTFRARCTCDGAILDAEFVYDGLHWDVY